MTAIRMTPPSVRACLAVLLALSAVSTASAQADQEAAEPQLQPPESGPTDGSEQAVEQAPKELPAAPKPSEHDHLARLREVLDDPKRAWQALRHYDELQTMAVDWDVALAERHRQEGDAELADSILDRARGRLENLDDAYSLFLRKYPNHARALNYHGELLYDRLGQQAGGIRAWKLATQVDEAYSIPFNNLAIHYSHVGDYDMSIRHFEQALALDPDNPDYLYNFTQIMLIHAPAIMKHYEWEKPKVYEQAMEMSRRAAELKPTDYDLLSDYATNFYAAENFGVEANWHEAAQAWARAREYAGRPDREFNTWLNEARAYIRLDNREQAIRCLEEALRIVPDSDVAKRLLAQQQGGGQ